MAGPDSPPRTLSMNGFRSSMSIAMPMIVLMTANPSEPASMHRRAFSWISVWLGESFAMIGFFVCRRQASTTLADISG